MTSDVSLVVHLQQGGGTDSTYLAVGNKTEDSLLERRPSLPI